MFDEEENNTDFAAENFLGAILRKEREMSRIFGNRRAKEDTTKNASSTSTKDFGNRRAKEGTTKNGSSTSTKAKKALKDDIEKQEKTFVNEEFKKNTTKNGSSISTKGKLSLKDDIEEKEKNTTYSWHPTSFKDKYTYKAKSKSESEYGMRLWSEGRMKIFKQTPNPLQKN